MIAVYQLLLEETPTSSPSPLQGGAFQILLNVIGGFVTVALIALYQWSLGRLRRRKFKAVFGEDVFSSDFHLVYAQLKLRPLIDAGKPDKHPYRKPDEEHLGAKFSIDRPVSSSETRAAKYLAETIGGEAKSAPSLSSDFDTRGRLDLSFISFGGPLSNVKTRDIIDNPSNDLIKFDNERFTTSESGRILCTPKPGFDYGLILKIHPRQFPNRTWFACAGVGEWGTSGAAWYLAKKWKEIHEFAPRDSQFAIVVRVKNDQDEYAEPECSIKSALDAERYAESATAQTVQSEVTEPSQVTSEAATIRPRTSKELRNRVVVAPEIQREPSGNTDLVTDTDRSSSLTQIQSEPSGYTDLITDSRLSPRLTQIQCQPSGYADLGFIVDGTRASCEEITKAQDTKPISKARKKRKRRR